MKSILFLAAALCAGTAAAQLAEPNAAGVSMGHLHVFSAHPEAQRAFWAGALGARAVSLGGMDAYALPGMLVLVKPADPTGGTEGSVVNHVGVKVRDLDAFVAKVRATGGRVDVTSASQAMVTGPDGIRVELTRDPNASAPVACHHIHLYATDVPAMQKWYAATFGAIPGKRARFDAADLPGVNLTFSPAASAPAPSRGRALDHIGFEVRNLEAFTRKLQEAGVKFDVPYRKVPSLGISIAFLTDPWGTYIELTEGLAAVR